MEEKILNKEGPSPQFAALANELTKEQRTSLLKTKEKLEEEKLFAEVEQSEGRILPMPEVAEKWKEQYNGTRYRTGIPDMDDAMKLEEDHENFSYGLAGGEILAIAGYPGDGKTLLSQTIAANMVDKEGIPVLYFSYEVSPYALWRKFVVMGADDIKDREMYVMPEKNESGGVEWIEKEIRYAVKKHLVGVVVVDHVGFLTPRSKSMSSSYASNYSTFLTQIIRELKDIAVKYNISIILPVHINKGRGEEPDQSSIANSSGIAQEVDFVWIMYRLPSENADEIKSGYTKLKMTKNRPGERHPVCYLTKIDGRLQVTDKPIVRPLESKW